MLPAGGRGGRREDRKELKKQGGMRAKRGGTRDGVWPQRPLSPTRFPQVSSPPHPCHMLVSRKNLGSQSVIPSTVGARTLPEGCCRGHIGPQPGAETTLITPGTSPGPRKPPASVPPGVRSSLVTSSARMSTRAVTSNMRLLSTRHTVSLT